MIDRGAGPTVVVIPGVQGRWEWLEPTIESLASRCRVITESLPGDPGTPYPLDPAKGFDGFVDWVDALLDRAGVRRAAICGVSYGGLVALRYAVRRSARTDALILVSTPAPIWQPSCRIDWYLRTPRLLSPVFALSSPFRLYPEIVAAFPDKAARRTFTARHVLRLVRHPFVPTRMAERVRLWRDTDDLSADCAAVTAPTLVVTGDPHLDRVVPVVGTREYVSRIPGATYVMLPDTGHVGLVTKADRFAELVSPFVTTRREPRRPTGARVPA